MSSSINIEHDDFMDTIMRHISSTNTSKKQLFVKTEELGKKWMVGIKIAQETINATIQSFV